MRMRMKGTSIALALALGLGACAPMSVADYRCDEGGRSPSAANPCVYLSRDDIKAPYKELGEVSEWKLGKFQRLGPEDAIVALQTQTRFLGGNAILITNSKTIYSGLISRGYKVDGIALDVTPPKEAASPASPPAPATETPPAPAAKPST
jgi:hypothetical protein